MRDVMEAIKYVSARVLEEWGMMTVDLVEGGVERFNQEELYYVANVHFKGVICGVYSIVCQQGFVLNLVQNLLGNEAQGTEEERIDALREMANVLSGNLITETYGADVTFELNYPTVMFTNCEGVVPLLRCRSFEFLADDEPLAVSFSLDLEG